MWHYMLGQSVIKIFTSTPHNSVISYTAVPNTPDKACLSVYITIDVLPCAYIDVMFVFVAAYASVNSHSESHVHVQVI